MSENQDDFLKSLFFDLQKWLNALSLKISLLNQSSMSLWQKRWKNQFRKYVPHTFGFSCFRAYRPPVKLYLIKKFWRCLLCSDGAYLVPRDTQCTVVKFTSFLSGRFTIGALWIHQTKTSKIYLCAMFTKVILCSGNYSPTGKQDFAVGPTDRTTMSNVRVNLYSRQFTNSYSLH